MDKYRRSLLFAIKKATGNQSDLFFIDSDRTALYWHDEDVLLTLASHPNAFETLKQLSEDGYLKEISGDGFSLSYAGLHARRLGLIETRQKFIWAILIPVIVSVITAILTAYVTVLMQLRPPLS